MFILVKTYLFILLLLDLAFICKYLFFNKFVFDSAATTPVAPAAVDKDRADWVDANDTGLAEDELELEIEPPGADKVPDPEARATFGCV